MAQQKWEPILRPEQWVKMIKRLLEASQPPWTG